MHVVVEAVMVKQVICLGHSLKKVEQEEKSATAFHGTDVEAILALRRLVVLVTDSESDSNFSEDDTEWDDT